MPRSFLKPAELDRLSEQQTRINQVIRPLDVCLLAIRRGCHFKCRIKFQAFKGSMNVPTCACPHLIAKSGAEQKRAERKREASEIKVELLVRRHMVEGRSDLFGDWQPATAIDPSGRLVKGDPEL